MKYEVAIIGGGIAGLSLAIDLGRRGYSVIVIEQGHYPRHKVCGEYISMESFDYLYSICPQLSKISLPRIDHFELSSTGKLKFKTKLELGGIGISRYVLEEMLFKEAGISGVRFMLDCKAQEIIPEKSTDSYIIKTNAGDVIATIVCDASGRKSRIDYHKTKRINSTSNYIGVKYHIKYIRDSSLIQIHNFPGGYCGISTIEENKSCLCYIVNSNYLKNSNNSIDTMERKYLYRNKQLRNIFENAEFIFKKPITISGINFKIKEPGSDNSFFLGDSAGSIAPITGNGMSMALRSAYFLANEIDLHLKNKITKQQLSKRYADFRVSEFSRRIKLSRSFQKLAEYSMLTNLTIHIFNAFPSLANFIIKKTHGNPF